VYVGSEYAHLQRSYFVQHTYVWPSCVVTSVVLACTAQSMIVVELCISIPLYSDTTGTHLLPSCQHLPLGRLHPCSEDPAPPPPPTPPPPTGKEASSRSQPASRASSTLEGEEEGGSFLKRLFAKRKAAPKQTTTKCEVNYTRKEGEYSPWCHKGFRM